MNLLKGKSKRTRVFAAITLLLIVALIGLNLLVSLLVQNNLLYIDMTPEELYTLSDLMIEECGFVNGLSEDKKIKITFCNDPDNLISSTVTRVTYFMALALEKAFDNIEVTEVNVRYEPTAVSQYKTTSLSEIKQTDVIVSCGDRYRIIGANNFWTVENGEFWSYNGEYRMATVMKSVSMANDNNPSAYFLTGHGEDYYDEENPESEGSVKTAAFRELLIERGLNVKLLDLSAVEAVPSDCALLIMNNPKTDYAADSTQFDSFSYVSETEKLDRYLTSNQGALIVAKNPETKLACLEDLLSEWGFEFSQSILRDEESLMAEDTSIISVYDTDEASYGYAIYQEFAKLESSPKTVFKNAGYLSCSYGENTTSNEPGSPNVSKQYAPFLTTPKSAQPFVKNTETGKYSVPEDSAGIYDLAAISARTAFDSESAEETYSYVFCVNSIDFFDSSVLGNASYANYDIVSALVDNMSRMDIYASMNLGATSFNSERYGGKQLLKQELSSMEETHVFSADGKELLKVNKAITQTAIILITVAVAAIPVIILVRGIIIFVKRKFL